MSVILDEWHTDSGQSPPEYLSVNASGGTFHETMGM